MTSLSHHKPLPRFLLLALLLFVSSSDIFAQESEDQAGFLDRFLAIFRVDQRPEPEVLDSIEVVEATQPGLTERYSVIYNLVHREQEEYYQSLVDSSYTRWDELTGLPEAKYISPDGDTVVLAKNIKVFGWHPHWMGSAYESYPFDLMSHVSLFSYNVNEGDGEPFDNPTVVRGWESPDFKLIEMAHEANCKVMLTITSFGTKKNKTFLDDPVRQERLIEDIVGRMIRIGADGIDVDFELIPLNYENQFSAFIMRLSDRIRKGNKRYQLSVVLPKVNGNNQGKKIYNIKLLQEYVDFFTLTAYDFKTGKNRPGPIAPLYNRDRKRRAFGSIEDVVFNYLEDGLDRSKLLLGLPHYGGRWSGHSREAGPDSLTFQHVTYAAIRKAKRGQGPPRYDRNAWAAVYIDSTASELEGFTQRYDTIWFDDSLTLSYKYDWVLEQQLGGVGFWALGYDLPYPELWGLIDEKFAPVNDTLVSYQPEQSVWDVPQVLMRYSDLFGISGLFVFAFLAIGFIVALFDWRVREVFFKQKTLRFLYIVASFALVTATLAIILFLRQDLLAYLNTGWTAILTLVIGLVSGVFLVRVISRWFAARREATP